jgi:dTDP-4-dehydrorhamnose 3,5-epimerase
MITGDISLPGCQAIRAFRASDRRGSLTKIFSAQDCGYLSLGEVFYTTSARGVLRGMHVQEPPHAQHKLVYCASGRAYDVLVDLRLGSPTYGAIYECTLSALPGTALLIAPGVAHGFLALDDDTVMIYCTTSVHAPESDTGVHWTTISASWPMEPTVVSERDQLLPPLGQYHSPFRFNPQGL